MKRLTGAILLMLSLTTWAAGVAHYDVTKGQLHTKGKVTTTILPDAEKFKVQMDFDVKKKSLVPVPSKLLKGRSVMEFPQIFRTEEGYAELEKKGSLDSPKAELRFVKRADFGTYKDAYFIQILPKNKKSKIDVVYHPSLPAVGWAEVKITFLSAIPVLDGYELQAKLTGPLPTSPQTAFEEAAQGTAVIIDVREKAELKVGMIKHARWFPMSKVDKEKNWKNEVLKLSEGKKVYLYCRSGRRSGILEEKLGDTALEIENIGGFEDLKAQLPVTKL